MQMTKIDIATIEAAHRGS